MVTAALWWIYFWPPHHEAIGSFASSLRYGYVHYFYFAAASATSAGTEVEIDVLTHTSKLGDIAASFTVTVPIAIFVLGIWWITLRDAADPSHQRRRPPWRGSDPARLGYGHPAVTAAFTAVIMKFVIVRPGPPTPVPRHHRRRHHSAAGHPPVVSVGLRASCPASEPRVRLGRRGRMRRLAGRADGHGFAAIRPSTGSSGRG